MLSFMAVVPCLVLACAACSQHDAWCKIRRSRRVHNSAFNQDGDKRFVKSHALQALLLTFNTAAITSRPLRAQLRIADVHMETPGNISMETAGDSDNKTDIFDETIRELLKTSMTAKEPEELYIMIGQKLEVVSDPWFLPWLEDQSNSSEGFKKAELSYIAQVVKDFLEILDEELPKVEEEIIREAERLQAERSRMEEAVSSSKRTPPRRRNLPPVTFVDPSKDQAITRQKNQAFLADLIYQGRIGYQPLDAMLAHESDKLTTSFFQYLQEQIDEYVRAKNEPMLTVLELITQRAALELRKDKPEMGLLDRLLMTKNPSLRKEIYMRELKPAESVHEAFVSLVLEMESNINQRIFNNEQIDKDFVFLLRDIKAEVWELLGVQPIEENEDSDVAEDSRLQERNEAS